jgi:K(+)-stimulated pyrophosphate-energized sodium pump
MHLGLMAIMPAQFAAAPIFAFGLVAFGFLGMGPVTIAVDSYGPVTDNAQSVYELSQIEGQPRQHQAKRSRRTSVSSRLRERQVSARETTARATPSRPPPSRCSSAPPSWATTMVFGIIMLLENMFGGVVSSARPSCPSCSPRSSSASSWAAR